MFPGGNRILDPAVSIWAASPVDQNEPGSSCHLWGAHLRGHNTHTLVRAAAAAAWSGRRRDPQLSGGETRQGHPRPGSTVTDDPARHVQNGTRMPLRAGPQREAAQRPGCSHLALPTSPLWKLAEAGSFLEEKQLAKVSMSSWWPSHHNPVWSRAKPSLGHSLPPQAPPAPSCRPQSPHRPRQQ